VRLECCYSATDVTDPVDWPSRFTAADGTTKDLAVDGTGNLHANGTVKFDAPPNWSAQRAAAPRPPEDGDPPVWTNVTDAPATAPLFWLGLRITATDPTTVTIGRVLFNSVSAHNALTIATPEQIGTSTGEPFQVWQLAHHPLYAPFGTDTAPPDLVVEIEPPPGPGQAASRSTWKQVDDLPAGAAEVYRCNPVTAEILFGDHDPTTAGDTGHGTVPPQGATIWASRYRYVASGTDGNVAPGSINTATTKLLDGQARPVNVTVTNLGPGFGGSDEEAVEDTLRRAPDMLRTHDRAVTASDYETLALRSTTDVVKTRCLTPKTFETTVTDAGGAVVARPGKPWLFGGLDRSPGNVNVIVVPDQGPDQPRPAPTQQLLTEVQGYLAGRCALTASVRVCGPLYLPIKVIAEVAFWDSVPDTVRSRVLDDTRAKIARVLHPTRGGVDGRGWQPGQSVFVSDLFGPIMPPADTGYITVLQVMPETPAYLPPGATPTLADRPVPLPTAGASFVEVCDYELVCAADSTDVKEASDA
jgi:predicted phage baseplate assembly protein